MAAQRIESSLFSPSSNIINIGTYFVYDLPLKNKKVALNTHGKVNYFSPICILITKT